MSKAICVYCASSSDVDDAYVAAAEDMGRAIARRGHRLVYGGGGIGLMGALARAAHARGGAVIGVIPQFMIDRELAYTGADELVVTADMRQRKERMERRADAFVTLPGGFGTLEELIEILTLRQLRLHRKPIVIVNTDGYYDRLLDLFEQFIDMRFAKDRHREAYRVVPDPEAAMDYLESLFHATRAPT